MRVFVAGGTGVVGTHLIPQLTAQRHEVTATTTNPTKLERLTALGATGVLMDGLKPESVRKAVTEAHPDVIVHQMTAIAGKPDMKRFDRWFATTTRLRTEGTDLLLAAAADVGVTHFVAQSYASWNGIREGGWVKSEDDPLDLEVGTKAQAVMEAVRYLEDAVLGVDGTVLRYGSLYGPGATDAQVDLVRKRQYPIIGNGAGYNSWIHVEDAAAATALAVHQTARGVFNIVDDEPAPANKWLPYLAESLGAKSPMRVPKWLAKIAAGDVAVTMMTEGRGFSNVKAKKELGWTLKYPSWREGFKRGLDRG
jgi:nucleoside-diphosphate-sugar epimerase